MKNKTGKRCGFVMHSSIAAINFACHIAVNKSIDCVSEKAMAVTELENEIISKVNECADKINDQVMK